MRIAKAATVLAFTLMALPIASRADDVDSITRRLWTSDTNSDCFVSDIVFERFSAPDGLNRTLHIRYVNQETDTGTWHLDGDQVTINLHQYGDSFVATYTGSTIQIAHSWRERGNTVPRTENCVLTQPG